MTDACTAPAICFIRAIRPSRVIRLDWFAWTALVARAARVSPAATGALLFALLTACATRPPALKEGLWQIHAQSVEKPSGRVTQVDYKLCRNHAYDRAADARLKNVKGCTTVTKDLGGGALASASNCTVDGIAIASTGVSTIKSPQLTHAESQATYSPPLNGKSAETITQDQLYLRACPPSMKVGDTLSAEGFIRHHD